MLWQISKSVSHLLIIVLMGTFGYHLIEGWSLFESLYMTIISLTTVGYGEIHSLSNGGKIFTMILIITGISNFAIVIRNLSLQVLKPLFGNTYREKKMEKTLQNMKDHFIICGWSYKAKEIISELRADKKVKDKPIVIIADIPEKPLEDENTYFIHGEVDLDILQKANLREASVVMVLTDEDLDSYSRDAKVVLNTLSIRKLNPNVYICVEISDSRNMQHGKLAGADEIIVIGELSGNLLVQAALDHGIERER